MPKLTDTQLVILSTAASRKGGAILPLSKSLKPNKGALAAILKGLLKQGLISERPAAPDEEHWRKQDDQRLGLAITENGIKALDGGSDEGGAPKPRTGKAQKKTAKPASPEVSKKPKPDRAAPAKGTKQDLLIELLKRKSGATIKETMKATGWQAHSVRGAISGTLKKKLKLPVKSETVDGRGRVYRIAGGR